MCVDLHTHSYYSDGTASPAELVQMAAERGLRALAVTDHDTMDGVEQAMEYGERLGVEVVPGLEISTVHNKRSIHILAYGIDPCNRRVQQWLERIQISRVERNRKIIVNLQRLGLAVTEEEVDAVSACGQTGRPHIAALMVRKNFVRNMDEAFGQYLAQGRPAWCRRFAYSTREAIDMIRQAGGVSVLAHPGLLEHESRAVSALIGELAALGLDGLEAYYPRHTARMQKTLLKVAGRLGLVVTGGSDYHGGNRPGIALAGSRGSICPPDEIADNLLREMERRSFAPGSLPADGREQTPSAGR